MAERQTVALWLILLVGLPGCATPTPPGEPALQFQDVTEIVGIEFRHTSGAVGDYHYPETFGSGVAWLDVDDDGWLDLYFVDGGYLADRPAGRSAGRSTNSGPSTHPVASTTDSATASGNRLYRNQSTPHQVGFVDVTEKWSARGRGYGMGVTAADVDGDGGVDLYVTNVGPNDLLLHAGHRFQAMPAAEDERWGTGCAFTDLDLDGDLDLAVVNYVEFDPDEPHACRRGSIQTYCDPDVYEPSGDVLYRNMLSETGRFQLLDVTAAVGFGPAARSLGIAVADLDLDGDSEIYVANDGQQNHLYRNDSTTGQILLEEVGLGAGARFNADGMAEAGMGIAVGDISNDGFPDLIVANFSRETHTYYRHTGSGLRFRDMTRDAGLARASFLPLGFGLCLLDADLDGDLDLFAAHGHVLDKAADIDPGLSYAQPDGLYLNDEGQLRDASQRLGSGFSDPLPSRSAAAADFDRDGNMDLVVTHVAGHPRLLRNTTISEHHWIVLELKSRSAGNPDGWGARVELVSDSGAARQTRQLQTGGSYLSAPPPTVHFGLGSDTGPVDVIVHWPGAPSETWSQIPVDRYHLLVRGSGT